MPASRPPRKGESGVHISYIIGNLWRPFPTIYSGLSPPAYQNQPFAERDLSEKLKTANAGLPTRDIACRL